MNALNELRDNRKRLAEMNARERSKRIVERHDKSFDLACARHPELKLRHAYRQVSNPFAELV